MKSLLPYYIQIPLAYLASLFITQHSTQKTHNTPTKQLIIHEIEDDKCFYSALKITLKQNQFKGKYVPRDSFETLKFDQSDASLFGSFDSAPMSNLIQDNSQSKGVHVYQNTSEVVGFMSEGRAVRRSASLSQLKI